MKIAVILIASVFIAVTSETQAPPSSSSATAPSQIGPGFVTGNIYRKMSSTDREAYAAGMIDGLLGAALFRAPRAETQWLIDCTVGMELEQVVAIFEKDLESRPEHWHEPGNFLFLNAFVRACPGSPFNRKQRPAE